MTGKKILEIIDENVRLRSKLDELANECAECDGTGFVTVAESLEAVDAGEVGKIPAPCPACADIRELLQ